MVDEELEAERERLRDDWIATRQAYLEERHAEAVSYHRLTMALHFGAIASAVVWAFLAAALLPWWLSVPLTLAYVAATAWAITPPVTE
jgi:deoxyribodipyrimidine photolyase